MDTVEKLCVEIGWNITDLAREARIAWVTARNAYDGQEPAPRTKRDICTAFSLVLRREIKVGDIEWKNPNPSV